MQSIQPCLARLPSRMLLVSAILRAVRASQTIRASGRPTHPHAKRLPSTLRCQLHGPRVLRNSNREPKLRVAPETAALLAPGLRGSNFGGHWDRGAASAALTA